MHRRHRPVLQHGVRYDQPKKPATKKATAPASSKATPKPSSKLGQLEEMLRRPEGATIPQLIKALAWQAHSIRGAMSGALKKKRGLAVSASNTEGAGRVYRIAS